MDERPSLHAATSGGHDHEDDLVSLTRPHHNDWTAQKHAGIKFYHLTDSGRRINSVAGGSGRSLPDTTPEIKAAPIFTPVDPAHAASSIPSVTVPRKSITANGGVELVYDYHIALPLIGQLRYLAYFAGAVPWHACTSCMRATPQTAHPKDVLWVLSWLYPVFIALCVIAHVVLISIRSYDSVLEHISYVLLSLVSLVCLAVGWVIYARKRLVVQSVEAIHKQVHSWKTFLRQFQSLGMSVPVLLSPDRASPPLPAAATRSVDDKDQEPVAAAGAADVNSNAEEKEKTVVPRTSSGSPNTTGSTPARGLSSSSTPSSVVDLASLLSPRTSAQDLHVGWTMDDEEKDGSGKGLGGANAKSHGFLSGWGSKKTKKVRRRSMLPQLDEADEISKTPAPKKVRGFLPAYRKEAISIFGISAHHTRWSILSSLFVWVCIDWELLRGLRDNQFHLADASAVDDAAWEAFGRGYLALLVFLNFAELLVVALVLFTVSLILHATYRRMRLLLDRIDNIDSNPRQDLVVAWSVLIREDIEQFFEQIAALLTGPLAIAKALTFVALLLTLSRLVDTDGKEPSIHLFALPVGLYTGWTMLYALWGKVMRLNDIMMKKTTAVHEHWTATHMSPSPSDVDDALQNYQATHADMRKSPSGVVVALVPVPETRELDTADTADDTTDSPDVDASKPSGPAIVSAAGSAGHHRHGSVGSTRRRRQTGALLKRFKAAQSAFLGDPKRSWSKSLPHLRHIVHVQFVQFRLAAILCVPAFAVLVLLASSTLPECALLTTNTSSLFRSAVACDNPSRMLISIATAVFVRVPNALFTWVVFYFWHGYDEASAVLYVAVIGAVLLIAAQIVTDVMGGDENRIMWWCTYGVVGITALVIPYKVAKAVDALEEATRAHEKNERRLLEHRHQQLRFFRPPDDVLKAREERAAQYDNSMRRSFTYPDKQPALIDVEEADEDTDSRSDYKDDASQDVDKNDNNSNNNSSNSIGIPHHSLRAIQEEVELSDRTRSSSAVQPLNLTNVKRVDDDVLSARSAASTASAGASPGLAGGSARSVGDSVANDEKAPSTPITPTTEVVRVSVVSDSVSPQLQRKATVSKSSAVSGRRKSGTPRSVRRRLSRTRTPRRQHDAAHQHPHQHHHEQPEDFAPPKSEAVSYAKYFFFGCLLLAGVRYVQGAALVPFYARGNDSQRIVVSLFWQPLLVLTANWLVEELFAEKCFAFDYALDVSSILVVPQLMLSIAGRLYIYGMSSINAQVQTTIFLGFVEVAARSSYPLRMLFLELLSCRGWQRAKEAANQHRLSEVSRRHTFVRLLSESLAIAVAPFFIVYVKWYYDQPTPEWRWIIVSAAVQWAVQFIGDLVGTMIDQVYNGRDLLTLWRDHNSDHYQLKSFAAMIPLVVSFALSDYVTIALGARI